MINTKALKKSLTLKHIYKLMAYLNAEPQAKDNKMIISKTICHNGDSHKLYYYANTLSFECYTNCGTFDIFELIQKIKDCNFKIALKFVRSFFDMKSTSIKLSKPQKIYQDPLEKWHQRVKDIDIVPLERIDDNILNVFYNICYISWIKEGIKPVTMLKYNIKLDIEYQRIIIPHFDKDNRLIGIRCRNLNNNQLKQGKKYMPITYKNKVLSYPTGQNLYGLNFNKSAINKYHKIILFEAEKSVMKLDSLVGNKNISVALNGSNLTDYQIALLNKLNINEIIIGLDKEFKHPFTHDEKIYAQKIQSEFQRLEHLYKVTVLWDCHDILNYKDSPIDRGITKFKRLCQQRFRI